MKSREKTLLHMYLPQTRKSGSNLYKLFRDKVDKKSNDALVDNGRNPVRLILNINHPVFDTQVGVIVKFNSFESIFGTEENSDQEIGFQAVVYSGFSKDIYRLRVFKAGKAYLEKIEEEKWLFSICGTITELKKHRSVLF